MACWRWAAGSSLRWDLKQGPQEVEHRAGRFQGVGPDSHLEEDQVGQKAFAAGCCLAVGRCTLRLAGSVPTKAGRRGAAGVGGLLVLLVGGAGCQDILFSNRGGMLLLLSTQANK